MPSQLNSRAVFAAISAFVLALAVAYALSSSGEASVPTGTPGEPAQPLDVASGVAGQTTLGDAEALPALVRRPKPPKKQKPDERCHFHAHHAFHAVRARADGKPRPHLHPAGGPEHPGSPAGALRGLRLIRVRAELNRV